MHLKDGVVVIFSYILSICHLFPKNALFTLLVCVCRKKEGKRERRKKGGKEGERREGRKVKKFRRSQLNDKHKYCSYFWFSLNPAEEHLESAGQK